MQQTSIRRPSRQSLVAAAPWVFVLLWSTGFIGARFGLPYIEPFTFLLIRFVVAAILLGMIALFVGAPWLGRPADAAHSAVVGLLLHGSYLGGVFYAIDRGMSAGLSSLIVSLQPILAAVISQMLLHEQVTRRQWAGLLLGLAGVGLVVGEKLSAPGAAPAVTGATLSAILIALVGTTLGTLYQKRYGAGIPLLSGTCTQYGAAAALMGLASLAFETRQIEWTLALLFSFAWLVLLLSLGAILLLMLLIRQRSAAQVTSLFYLVPPATALEAYLLFGEGFGPLSLAGLCVASVGVALVVAQPAR